MRLSRLMFVTVFIAVAAGCQSSKIPPVSAPPLSVSAKTDILGTVRADISCAIRARTENIAGAFTPGYKKIVPAFGAPGAPPTLLRDFSQGAPIATGRPLDICISGEGFLMFTDGAGRSVYTRYGSLMAGSSSQLVLASNPEFRLRPSVCIPAGTTQIAISDSGRVICNLFGATAPCQVGQIQIARFDSPELLASTDGTFFTAKRSTGDIVRNILGEGVARVCNPGDEGAGTLLQNALESSNVDAKREVKAIVQLVDWYRLTGCVPSLPAECPTGR
jgi:flagellar hook protein FlgE